MTAALTISPAMPGLNGRGSTVRPHAHAATRLAPWLAVGAVVIAALVLVGWFAEIRILRTLLPGLATMKVNTALGILGLGAATALFSVRHDRGIARRAAVVLAAGVLLLALATLAQYVLGVSFGIDELVRRDDDSNIFAPYPGRMAIATITAFSLSGGAVLVAALGRRRLAAALAVGSLGLAWLSLMGYAYGFQEIGGIAGGTQMAIHTAIAQALIAVAILMGPVAGGTTVLSRATLGGAAARRVAIAGLVILPVIGAVRLAGERAGLFQLGFGVTMMTTASSIGVVIIALWLGRSLDRISAQRDKSTAELATMFARYRAASEGGLDAFYLLAAVRDDAGTIVDFTCLDLNTRAAERSGLTVDASRGTKMSDWTSADELRRFIAAYATVVNDGTTMETEFPLDRGETSTWMRHQVTKVGDGVALVSRDITTEVRAREAVTALNRRLEERNADLHDFASVVSHDIRAPLRRIQLYGEQLELDAGDRLGADLPLLQRMRSSAEKLERLVTELLAYARVEESDRAMQPVDLRSLVNEVLEDLAPALREAGGTVKVGDLPAMAGEPVLLRQLFTNLIGNAIKFRRPGVDLVIAVDGRIILTSDGDAQTEIVVRDNGIGFDPQYAERIFGIFERLHGEREYEGTGIGLAICRKIAFYHQGSIEASGQRDEGATFTVRLPRPIAAGSHA